VRKTLNKILSFFASPYTNKEDNYIQMRLQVSHITVEFDRMLRERAKNNQLHIEVREAAEKDIDSLIGLHDCAWSVTPMPYRPMTRDSIIEKIKDPAIIFLIANVNGVDSGFALIYFTGDKMQVGVIAGMGIVPSYQRKGLGTVLGLACWDYFKKKGVLELRCKVYKDNIASYKFIKGLGFEVYNEDFVTWKVI
jgi:ribosomal protein S18 acetylase RimI-like enzyme